MPTAFSSDNEKRNVIMHLDHIIHGDIFLFGKRFSAFFFFFFSFPLSSYLCITLYAAVHAYVLSPHRKWKKNEFELSIHAQMEDIHFRNCTNLLGLQVVFKMYITKRSGSGSLNASMWLWATQPNIIICKGKRRRKKNVFSWHALENNIIKFVWADITFRRCYVNTESFSLCSWQLFGFCWYIITHIWIHII